MKVAEKSGYEKYHPKIMQKAKEKYEVYKRKRELRKEKAFRETFKDEEDNDTSE